MKLPNSDRAVVDLEKLRNYCLDPNHPRGRFKARVFLAACGATAANAEDLQGALTNAAREFEAEPGKWDAYGRRYVIDFHYRGPTGIAPIRSVWIVRVSEDFPRLVTCYVL